MEGTVLVDEIDLHLHPAWQVKLIPALKQVFPRLQFIATTHSPMILPALSAEEVYLITEDGEGSVVATQSAQSPALLTGTELFRRSSSSASCIPARWVTSSTATATWPPIRPYFRTRTT